MKNLHTFINLTIEYEENEKKMTKERKYLDHLFHLESYHVSCFIHCGVPRIGVWDIDLSHELSMAFTLKEETFEIVSYGEYKQDVVEKIQASLNSKLQEEIS